MQILAIVTADSTKVSGGTPIFYAEDQEGVTKLLELLKAILGAAVHDLQNGVYVIVKH